MKTNEATEAVQIPAGYVQDREGHLVPKDKVKQIDKDRDVLVKKIAKKARGISGELAALKAEVFEMVSEFIEKSASEYGAKVGGKKGNVTLFSYDGELKVQISRGVTQSFDERLQTAKVIIDECIHVWAKGANKNLQALMDHAFQVDKEGKVSVERILGLRRLKIDDPRWHEAMRAIADSIQINSSKTYFRVFEKVGDAEEYRRIPLDAASA